MLVIATEGLLTMVQRDSRECLGDFVVRAWETHKARLRSCGTEHSSLEPAASPHSVAVGARRKANALKGCSYAPEAQAPEAHAREAQAPEAQAPEAHAPEAHAPEAQAPEAHAPEAHARDPLKDADCGNRRRTPGGSRGR